MPRKLYTTAQAAEELGLSQVRVRQLIDEGRLRAERAGRVWAIRARDLEVFKALERRPGRPPK